MILKFALSIAIEWCIVSLAALPLTLLAGHGGMLSLAQGAFFGVGAYAAGVVALRLGWGFGGALVTAVLAAIVLAVLSGVFLKRLRSDAFVLASLALVAVCAAAASNWFSLTRGALGLTGIPRPLFVSCGAEDDPCQLLLCGTILALGVLWMVYLLRWSRFGLQLRSIREGPLFSAALGENVPALRWRALISVAGMTGAAGALHAQHLGFLDPTVFDPTDSLLYLAVVMLGGINRLRGAFVGSVLFVIVPQILRYRGVGNDVQANANQMLFGLSLLIILLWKPRGILGTLDLGALLSSEEQQ